MLPPIESPPTLTGEMPVQTLTESTWDRVDVGQHRVHVVGAGGDKIHAINLDAQSVISQAMHDRKGLETPPDPCKLTPGTSRSRLAVSLVELLAAVPAQFRCRRECAQTAKRLAWMQ
jgi:hypothetical protein